jgi:hypothetical protein
MEKVSAGSKTTISKLGRKPTPRSEFEPPDARQRRRHFE